MGRYAMRRKPLLAVVLCTAALVGASATAAFAGEVKGPPGTPNADPSLAVPPAGGSTGAQDHANSICVFSGLNDMLQGPTDTIVQTPGHFMLAGLTPPGVPGHGTNIPGFENGCRGGSN
jgi:hypothetical protein